MISDQSTKSQTIARPASPVPAPTRSSNRSWDSCAALPECQVPLTGLEISITFDSLGEPIRYDSERGLLLYRGTMSHASFLHLQKVCRERHYQRALEQLFVASAMPPPASTSSKPWLMATGAAGAAAIVLGGLWYSLSGEAGSKAPEVVRSSAVSAGTAAQVIPIKADAAAQIASERVPSCAGRSTALIVLNQRDNSRRDLSGFFLRLHRYERAFTQRPKPSLLTSCKLPRPHLHSLDACSEPFTFRFATFDL